MSCQLEEEQKEKKKKSSFFTLFISPFIFKCFLPAVSEAVGHTPEVTFKLDVLEASTINNENFPFFKDYLN